MNLTKEEKLSLNYRFEQYLKHISKYPTIVYFLKSKYFKQEILKLNFRTERKTAINFNDVKKYFDEVIKLFIEVEKSMETIETDKDYLVKTYKFNAEKVVNHCRNITKISNQINYLTLALKAYKLHSSKRENIFKHLVDEVSYDFEKYSNVLQFVIDNISNEEIRSYANAYLETFEDKINRELEQIQILKNSKEDGELSEMLKEINLEDYEKPEIDNSKSDQLDRYLTTKELMEKFQIKSSVTVHNWIKSEKIKAHKIGRRNYFKESEVKELLEDY